MLIGLFLFILATICSPGAANLLAADGGARVGVRRSAGLIAGIAATCLLVVALCAAGVGALVTAAPPVRLALRVVGSVYLLWLASRILQSHAPGGDRAEQPPRFRTGVLSTAVNPKTWTVGLAASAGFSGLAPSPLLLVALLTAAFAVVVVPNLFAWAWLGAWIGDHLATPRRWRAFASVLCLLLVVSVATLWLD